MTCDPNTLSQQSSCLRCLTDAQLNQVRTFLLCRIANVGFFPVLSGLILRNESSDFDAVANSTPVTQWLDRSGGNHNWSATNPPVVDRAITANGHATVKFISGTPAVLQQSSYFGPTGFLGLEVMAVYRHAVDPPVGSDVGPVFMFNRQDANVSHQPFSDDHFYENFGETVRMDLGVSGVNTSASFICYNLSVKADGTLYDAYLNSVNFFHAVAGYTFNQQGANDVVAGYFLGASSAIPSGALFTGNVAALYVWNRTLTTTERTAMRAYITRIYGVTF